MANVLFQVFTIGLFAFYLVAEGPKLRRTVCSLLPQKRQRYVLEVWDVAIAKTGGYIVSRGVLAVIAAVVHWAAFEIIDLPSGLALAIWVGVVSQVVPVVGTYLAGALPVLIGLIDEPASGLWVLVVIAVYQQVENYVLAPRITSQDHGDPRRHGIRIRHRRRCTVGRGRCHARPARRRHAPGGHLDGG